MAKKSFKGEHVGGSVNDEPEVEALPLTVGDEHSTADMQVDMAVAEHDHATGVVDQSEDNVPEKKPPSERRELVKSATLVSLGNLGSSLLGMVRQAFIASTGAAISGPFIAALTPAQRFNDFLVNGAVSGALIPTFNDYAEPEKREEFRRLVFTIANLVLLVVVVSTLGYLFLSHWFIYDVLVPGYDAQGKELTLQYSRIIFFSLLALGPFAVLQAALYAKKEFGWTAFATAAYHVGIIVGASFTAVASSFFYGARYGIAFGTIVGALGEIALLLPGMRNQSVRYMFVLDLKHPALRRILKLYGPVALSFIISISFGFLDQNLASQTPCAAFVHSLSDCGEHNLTAMNLATTLIQFPIGLVAAALSFAVLPTLTTHMREGDTERFKKTLLLGFRLGLLLMIPAAAGLIVLRTPIIGFIFQRHNFSADDTLLTATALQNYAYQLPFVAIDQLLIAASYARKNTIAPVAVMVVSFGGYLAVALPFWHTIGMPALALANSVQNSLHAIALLVVMRFSIGSMHLTRLIPTLIKILIATALLIAVAWGIQVGLGMISSFFVTAFLGRIIVTVVAGGLAAIVYFGVVVALKVEEVAMLRGAVLAKLGRK